MPSSGPEDHVIKSEITRTGPDYELVKLTPSTNCPSSGMCYMEKCHWLVRAPMRSLMTIITIR